MRLPFGVKVSGDAAQRKNDEIYNPLPNVIGIADDIIIWGDKKDGSDHNAALAYFLQVTRENGLRINFDKIQYKTTKVTFFGKTYTTKGHKPAWELLSYKKDNLCTSPQSHSQRHTRIISQLN